MLEYTRMSIQKTVDDFKTFFYFYNVASQLFYIGYLIYAICTRAGVLAVNIILAIVSAAYFIFYMFAYDNFEAEMRKSTGKLFKWFKLAVRAFTLGVMVYGIYAATTHITVVSVVMSGLMLLVWVFQVLLELCVAFVESRAKLIIAGIEADIDNLLKPVHAVGNFIKKATGQGVEEKKEPSRHRKVLDKLVGLKRAEKQKEREEKMAAHKMWWREKLGKKKPKDDEKAEPPALVGGDKDKESK